MNDPNNLQSNFKRNEVVSEKVKENWEIMRKRKEKWKL